MSHFSVLVIGDDIEGQMAPYDENLETEPYLDLEDPASHWQAGATRKELSLAEDAPITAEQIVRRYNANYTSLTNLLPTADEARAAAEDDGVLFVHDGKVGQWSTRNPQAKWDYWREGGRWRGFFKLTEVGMQALAFGADDAPRQSVKDWDSPEEVRSGVWCDSALKRHIDFIGMRETAAFEAQRRWDRYVAATAAVFASGAKPMRWDDVRERADSIEAARSIYHAQPYVRALRAADMDLFGDEPLDYYGPDLSESSAGAFIRRAADAAISPYAVVKGGEWHAKAEMGWFGMSHDEQHSQSEWNSLIVALIDALGPDDRLTVVDCHI